MPDSGFDMPTDTMIEDKRNFLRMPVDRIGEIETQGGAILGQVQLKDMSMAGAQLVLKNTDELPEAFRVKVQNVSRTATRTVRCHLIWQCGSTAGVRFR